MILADTSAWIEYLRATESPTHLALRRELRLGSVATTEPVLMEVLLGGRSPAHVEELEALLARSTPTPIESEDFRAAARLYRQCRTHGVTIRSSVDCLIGAVSIRTGLTVLHLDKDFDALGRHTTLTVRSS
ncbi:MAG: type II toxin-antitoxin system VapC family toxin [Acidimicrobiales bacterium]